MSLSKYQEAKKIMDDARDTMRKTAKGAFEDAAIAVFEKHPNLDRFSWTQYTPYFNDGDECVFRAGTNYPAVVMKDDEFGEDADYHDFEDDDYYINKQPRESLSEGDLARLDVIELLSQFDEDTYKDVFGDHTRVVVTRDGIETEEYEHD